MPTFQRFLGDEISRTGSMYRLPEAEVNQLSDGLVSKVILWCYIISFSCRHFSFKVSFISQKSFIELAWIQLSCELQKKNCVFSLSYWSIKIWMWQWVVKQSALSNDSSQWRNRRGGGVESLYTESLDNLPKSSILCPNWTHLYTVSLWEIHANFHIIACLLKTRQ